MFCLRNQDITDAKAFFYLFFMSNSGYLITSRELSRKFRGFNSGDIFTALDELDQGKKLQAEQRAAKRSPGLDFEM